MATIVNDIAFCHSSSAAAVDGTTIEVIASSGQCVSAQATISGSTDTISLQLVTGTSDLAINPANPASADCPSGVEELQTFLNNFNSELAAENRSTVCLIDSSCDAAAVDSSFLYQPKPISTLVYEDGRLANDVTTATAMQIVQFAPGNCELPVDGQQPSADQQREIYLFPRDSPNPPSSTNAESFQSTSSSSVPFLGAHDTTVQPDLTMATQEPGVQEQRQEILIPLDCTNALVNGNQLLPGSTVLLPVIPTMLANGAIEVRISGQAITFQSPASTSTPRVVIDKPSDAVRLPQQEPILLILGSSDCGTQLSVQETTNVEKLYQKKPLQQNQLRPKKIAAYSNVKLNFGSQTSVADGSDSALPVERESNGDESDNGSLADEKSDDQDGAMRIDMQPETKSKKSNSVPQQGVFQCEFCDYTNVKKYLLVRHMKCHSEDRPFLCSICDKRFKSANSLQNHVNTHTGVKPHRCQLCEASFTTSGEMVRHMRYKHTQEKPHKCTHCDYASVELSKLKRHLRSHTGERPYQCTYCSYASPDMYKLKRHTRVHTGEKPYVCDVCSQRFTQSNSLKAHKLIHSNNKPVYQCEYCASTCGRKTDLKIHVQKQHATVDRPLSCRKCEMQFVDRYSLKLHRRSHESENCIQCISCSYSTQSQRHLDDHRALRPFDQPLLCPSPSCGRAFRSDCQLKRHCDLEHDDVATGAEDDGADSGKFQCQYCQKEFRKESILRKHERSHRREESRKKSRPSVGFIESEDEESGEEGENDAANVNRSYRCSSCNESFGGRVQFELHRQLEHIGADASAEKIIYIPTPTSSTKNRLLGPSRKSGSAPSSNAGVGTSKRPKRKLRPKSNVNEKRKRAKAKESDETTFGLDCDPLPVTPVDVELEHQRQLENCFGFVDVEMDAESGKDRGETAGVDVESGDQRGLELATGGDSPGKGATGEENRNADRIVLTD